MHPSHGVAREYQARVRGVPDRRTLERLSAGVMMDGRKTAPAEVRIDKVFEASNGEDALLSITLHEGRNRQVRRMCDAVGHPVVRLRRVRIGPIHDEHIRPGEFRDLDEREVMALKKAAGSRSAPPHPEPTASLDSGESLARSRQAVRTPNHRRTLKHPSTSKHPSTLKHPEAPRSTPKHPVTPRRADRPRTERDPRSRAPRRSGRPRRG